MAYVIVIVALVAILLVVTFVFMINSGRAGGRASQSPKLDFEIVNWDQNSASSRKPPEGESGQEFSHGVRWQNPDAICLLTGQRAATCRCSSHRKMK